jgi:uncharacterized damage-inducible protein DinB
MTAPIPLTIGTADVRAIVAYNRSVFERYARRVRRLSRAAAFRRREIGHQSFFDTLVHILNVHEVWLVYIVRGRADELETLFGDKSRHPRDWPGFRTYADRVWSGVEATGRRLTPAQLGRPVKAPWMPGRYTVRDAVLQTTLEQAHHLGEMIGAFWQDDLEPPEMTWIDTRREAARRPRRR